MQLINRVFHSNSQNLRLFVTLLALGLISTATAQRTVAQETVKPTAQANGQSPTAATATKSEKEATQDLSNLSLEDLMKIRVNSVYSASKYLQKVTEAPASVSIITAEDIKRYGYRTLAAAISSVRGFYVNYTRSYWDLGARGFARPGDFNTRVLLLVDGHRISDNVYSSALLGSEFPIDMDLIDRIEVIRGPSSSLYGTNAFFGVINVITKRGQDIDGFELSSSYASQDSYRGRLSYGKRFSSGVDLLVSASLGESRGNQKLYFKEFDQPETNNGVAVNADDEDLDQFYGSISWRSFSVQGVYGHRKKTIPTAPYGTAFNDPGTNTADNRGYLDFKYRKNLGTKSEFAGRLYYDSYYYQGNYIYTYDTENGSVRIVNKDSARGEWWGAEGSLTATISSRYRFTAGGEYRKNLKQDQLNYTEGDPSFVFEERNKSREWAGYVENQFRFAENLLVNGGVRYDHSNAFGGSTNPRLALVYNPLEKTTLKFLYGQAFRAPNVYELYFYPNTHLEPERIKTAEFVLEQYLGDHVRLAGSAFTYRINNLITQVPDEFGFGQFVNVGRVKSTGIEAEAEVKSQIGLQGLLSYAFQSSRDSDTGEKLTNSPAHMLKLNFNGPIGIKRTFAGLEVQYLSDRVTPSRQNANSFLITNLTVLSEQFKERLDLSFSIYNLFDRKYANPGSAENQQDVIPQDGRTFRFKLTYRFSNK